MGDEERLRRPPEEAPITGGSSGSGGPGQSAPASELIVMPSGVVASPATDIEQAVSTPAVSAGTARASTAAVADQEMGSLEGALRMSAE